MKRIRTLSRVLLLLAALTASGVVASEAPVRLAPGIDLFEADDLTAALDFFNSVTRGSDSAWVDFYVGRIHLQRDEIDEAVESLSASVEADPESSVFHRWLGQAYVQKIDRVGMLKKMGLAKKALTSFERAVALSPHDIEAREALSDYYLNAPAIAGGSRDKAMEQVAELRKLDPVKGRLLMGRIYMDDEDWKAAAEQYRQLIEEGHASVEAYYQLGFALQQDKDYKSAIEAFERAIEIDPQDLAAYYQLGRTSIFSSSYLDRAVECLSYYLEQPPQRNSPAAKHAHWRLGMVYELQNKKELAAAEYREALRLDPDHKEARKALKSLGMS